jgi:hypothetical protein
MHLLESIIPFKNSEAAPTASHKTRTRIFTASLTVCKGGDK